MNLSTIFIVFLIIVSALCCCADEKNAIDIPIWPHEAIVYYYGAEGHDRRIINEQIKLYYKVTKNRFHEDKMPDEKSLWILALYSWKFGSTEAIILTDRLKKGTDASIKSALDRINKMKLSEEDARFMNYLLNNLIIAY
jgi:hypothetical protein